MSPLTHLATGWVFAVATRASRRERALISAAAVFPDLDGFGVLVDALTGHATEWWPRFHHVLLHGLFGALLMAAIAAGLAQWRTRAAVGCFVAVHLHLLEDLAGAGGPLGDRWPIAYLGPFSHRLELEWAHQWALNAWPNIVLTAVLLAVILRVAWSDGISPLEWISKRANAALTGTLRARFGAPASVSTRG